MLLLAALPLVVSCRHGKRNELSAGQRPNIVLITLDTVRYDATPAAARSRKDMPFFSKLVKSGVNFTEAYSTFDSTPESHMSMLTGFQSGFLSPIVDETANSVPYQLRAAGYRTFGIAANGNLTSSANADMRGFNDYVCLWDEKLPDAQRAALMANVDKLLDSYGVRKNEFNRMMRLCSYDRVLDHFQRQLDRQKPAQPFFAFLNVIDAHDPYVPDPKRYDWRTSEARWNHAGFDSDVRERKLAPELAHPTAVADPQLRSEILEALQKTSAEPPYRKWSGTFGLSNDELQIYHARYLAGVGQLDTFLLRVFETLRDHDVLDSTIVIVTSDHGESFGEEHLITHSFLNKGDRETTHHVPLVIVFPPSYKLAGRTVATPVSGCDVAPTIYDLAGVQWFSLSALVMPGDFGRSLVPLFGDVQVPRPTDQVRAAATSVGTDKSHERANAERRLRALGYIQ